MALSPPLPFAGCGVAVLGGTAGVGLETASQFVEQGARVVLLGRDHDRGAVACKKLRLRASGGEVSFVRVDATDPNDTLRAEQECRAALGSIDVLVNTTGPSDHPRLLHTIPIQFVAQRISEIILPPLHMMHAALPAMRGNGTGVDHQRRLRCGEGGDARGDSRRCGDGRHRDVLQGGCAGDQARVAFASTSSPRR